MKTELIEYHRDKARNYEGIASAKHGIRPDVRERYTERLDFHERAVAWLESLVDREALAETISKIMDETRPSEFQYPVLTVEQAEVERKRLEALTDNPPTA